MTTLIKTSIENRTLLIVLEDEEGRPSLGEKTYRELADVLESAKKDTDVRCVILKGFAGCFCRGADLSEFCDREKFPALISSVTAYFRALAEFTKPLLACVDGEATGVGCTTLFHCDLVFASERSTFRVPFVDFGLVPDAATSLLAPNRLGYADAFRFFCLGEMLDAKQAHAIGLATDLCHGEEIETFESAMAVARLVARKPQGAIETARKLLRGDTSNLCRRIDTEIELFRAALEDDRTIRRLMRLASLAA